MLVKPRPWWKFWPVICWRHFRLVPKDDVCPQCADQAEGRRQLKYHEAAEQFWRRYGFGGADPNPRQTRQEFMRQLVQKWQEQEEAVVWLVENSSGKVVELQLLPSGRVVGQGKNLRVPAPARSNQLEWERQYGTAAVEPWEQ